MVTRRDVIKGAGVAGAAAATGSGGWWALSGTEFAPDTVENELEDDADHYRSELENLVGDIDSGEDIDGELDRAIKDVSIPSDAEEYRGRGVKLTDKFNVAIPADGQSFHIPREDDGDSVLYTWQEGTEEIGLDGAVRNVRNDMGLSSEDQRLFDEVKEELGGAVLYTATTEDNQPDYDESDIDELESVHEQIESEYQNALERLDDLNDVITDSRSLRNQLEAQEFQKSHKIFGHEVWGEEFTGEQITKDETHAMLSGDDPYSEIGVNDTYNAAQAAYSEAAMDVARIGLVSELVGQTIADAKGQLDTYGAPDDSNSNGDNGNGGNGNGTESYEDLVPDSCGYEDRVVDDLEGSGYEPSELDATIEADGELFVESTVDDWSKNYAAECS